MSKYIIKKYDSWLNSMSEAVGPDEESKDRAVEKEGKSKVVYEKIDGNSFLVKYIKQPIVDNNNRLYGEPRIVDGKVSTQGITNLNQGWNETLRFLDEQGITRDYPKLKDNNFLVVYNVVRPLFKPNRVVITYTIYPKSDFNEILKDPNILAINADDAGIYAIDNKTGAEVKNKVLNVDQEAVSKVTKQDKKNQKAEEQQEAAKGGKAPAIKISRDIPLDDLKYLSPTTKIFSIINAAVVAIGKAARAEASTGISKSKTFNLAEDELDSGKIGDNVVKILKALMKSYGIYTTDARGREKELLNQQFADKIAQLARFTYVKEGNTYVLSPNGKLISESLLLEAETYTLDDLFGSADSVGKFIKSLEATAEATTGTMDVAKVKFPINFGVEKSEDLKVVQKLMVDKLTNTNLNKLADKDFYKKFMRFKDDGDYGGGTRDTVAALKRGFKLSDTDGNTITKEFVDKLNTYNEK